MAGPREDAAAGVGALLASGGWSGDIDIVQGPRIRPSRVTCS